MILRAGGLTIGSGEEVIGVTTGVRQIAADLLRHLGRQGRAITEVATLRNRQRFRIMLT
jgi:hypothetical protein